MIKNKIIKQLDKKIKNNNISIKKELYGDPLIWASLLSEKLGNFATKVQTEDFYSRCNKKQVREALESLVEISALSFIAYSHIESKVKDK